MKCALLYPCSSGWNAKFLGSPLYSSARSLKKKFFISSMRVLTNSVDVFTTVVSRQMQIFLLNPCSTCSFLNSKDLLYHYDVVSKTSYLREFKTYYSSLHFSTTVFDHDTRHSFMLRGGHQCFQPSSFHFHLFTSLWKMQLCVLHFSGAINLTRGNTRRCDRAGEEGDVERRVVEWCVGGWR